MLKVENKLAACRVLKQYNEDGGLLQSYVGTTINIKCTIDFYSNTD